MKKSIVLCADDYGQAPAISNAIINLIKDKRLSATTCLVNSSFWHTHANWLFSYQGEVDIGLHFNLTEGKALSPLFQQTYGEKLIPLPRLMRLALFRQLKKPAILAELHAQLDAFQAGLSSLPCFVDGHQHVHQFPVIREALNEAYQARLKGQKTYIRWVGESAVSLKNWLSEPKKMVIYFIGRGAKSLFKANQIPHNASFSGIYSFAKRGCYHKHFPQFLREIESGGGLIMCHPALSDETLTDSIKEARYEEYQYLASPQFRADCEAADVILSRFSSNSCC